ncbi:adenosylcobinamide kinase/adenosylcobinamide phosphate guanyltransferase [Ferrigenium kumadai]|uniref:Bifunctional adenosylcobalamin biosynthesis protein n=1 Tax=Ferrigenium kumadai TaxID=1682490 RepID=A0AAN1T0F0_9PROT|nr:bifunctional adenosylcobinamide kinase/adenosylcobinamide-phosphate guanylyltransferase [Ferrigenium kumadai]BBJ00436.1 adenosylcobinamide kinase/adenosylcobinamide phosphate guanyltransferase [Ferrigenium kumadai]
MKELILGGMRSGKSRLAEQHAQATNLPVTYVATATAQDDEMRQRIAHHQSQRPDHWLLVEEPIALAASLQRHAVDGHCILLDCLTLWLTNLLCLDDEARLRQEVDALLDALPKLPGTVILVSNETGMGVVPLGELTRRYCDEAGRLHQAVAARCDKVVMTVAGLPLVLKG